jgi:oligoribonuclease
MSVRTGNAFEALAADTLEDSLNELRIADEKHASNRSHRKLKDSLIWIDLEMTGLDVSKDSILQIAVVITDGDLSTIVKGPELAIHHSDEVLANMNEWCIEHHGRSGLTEKVRKSTIDMKGAETQVVEFIEKYAEEGTQIAGNSVHVDVQFLKRRMPRITDYCHYRIVDVSSIGELCRRWYPKEDNKRPKKKLAHTAMSDILESIEQLKYYRRAIFKK